MVAALVLSGFYVGSGLWRELLFDAIGAIVVVFVAQIVALRLGVRTAAGALALSIGLFIVLWAVRLHYFDETLLFIQLSLCGVLWLCARTYGDAQGAGEAAPSGTVEG